MIVDHAMQGVLLNRNQNFKSLEKWLPQVIGTTFHCFTCNDHVKVTDDYNLLET